MPGMSHRCEFALDCAKRCLDLYDDYFKTPYPLPKLDMIAIPGLWERGLNPCD
jgi:aminopeptidase N